MRQTATTSLEQGQRLARWILLVALATLANGCSKNECEKAADAYSTYHKPYHQRLLDQYDPAQAVPLGQRSDEDRAIAKARGLKSAEELDRFLLLDETKRELVPREWIVENCENAPPERKAELSCMAKAKNLDAYASCRNGKGKFEVPPPM